MDYIKPVGLRLVPAGLHHRLAFVGCAGWGFQVLWRL